MEIWKVIEKYPYYEISDYGNIRRCCQFLSNRSRKDKNLKKRKTKFGYNIVNISLDGKRYTLPIHILVLETFIGVPSDEQVCNHIDGNKSNNKLENLEWTTRSENQKHAYKIGLQEKLNGEKNPHSKLTKDDVIDIRKIHNENMKIKDISKIFNISISQVSKICNFKQW